MAQSIRCPRCRNFVKQIGNEVSFWCTCGWHGEVKNWIAPEEGVSDVENGPQPLFKSEPIPDVETSRPKPSKRKYRAGIFFRRESRQEYLIRNELTEKEIMKDSVGREWWIDKKGRMVFVPNYVQKNQSPW